MNTRITGNAGEDMACEYLLENGYTIISRNWRTRTGEIDIIVEKAETVVFIEVKTLPNGTPDMLKRELNYQKLQRIVKTSKRFLQNNRQYSNSYVRFDVIIIGMPGLPQVYHIENAFAE